MILTGRSDKKQRKSTVLRNRNIRNGLLFVIPGIIGFCVFFAYPIFTSVGYGFYNIDLMRGSRWIGLDNYIRLFHDPVFYKALYNTGYYIALFVPLSTVMAIVIAALLNAHVRFRPFFRTLFFLPAIVPVVAAAVMWMWILEPRFGLVNTVLGLFGIDGPLWLASAEWSKPGLVLMSLWTIGYPILIYLAGLQNIPKQMYEVAELDGASVWAKFISVTVPLLSPVILFNVVIQTIASFQYFTQAFIMTEGGPMESTIFYALYIYQRGFARLEFGYASSLAVVLLCLVLVATLLIFRFSSRFVYYGGK